MSTLSFFHRPENQPPTSEGFAVLADLAFDLRSSWTERADVVWSAIDPDLWRETGKAWLVLQTASHDRIRELWAAPSFRSLVESLLEQRRASLAHESWFRNAFPGVQLSAVAYFSLESP